MEKYKETELGLHVSNPVETLINIIPEKSLFQPIWNYLRENHQDTLRSPLLPVIISVSTYFILCLFYTTLDCLCSVVPSINRYRIHASQPVKLQNVLKALGLTFYNHVVFVFPASVAQWYWRPELPLEEVAPTVPEFTLGVLGCIILFDFQYYLWHLVHHRSQWLYVNFHAIHHEYSRPFCWVTQYMSAWELTSVGFWTTVDPVLLRCHTITGYAFMVFNIWVSVDDHSGYDFPWSIHNLVPFGLWGGSVKHDTHHRRPTTNFEPFFSHWDWLCGTNSEYHHSPAMAAEKKKTPSTDTTKPIVKNGLD
ncbi:cholesterol 25-hydroxylase-like protein 2 [Megalops cyprinoides]|uniref:cholesterol 25-hydroxylase-like protein 2 n=1 Tax=Megalops cyprinoides TaxID=118141 RepID=UPI001863C8FD|nr:cholesterol 25-hydroxylase-like protein 2 [Megalops cyprinoides]